jgi:hypothetical protein
MCLSNTLSNCFFVVTLLHFIFDLRVLNVNSIGLNCGEYGTFIIFLYLINLIYQLAFLIYV